jgi:hypothetical protein
MFTNAFLNVFTSIITLPILDLNEFAATLIGQAMKGFAKETFENADIARIGREELAEHEVKPEK